METNCVECRNSYVKEPFCDLACKVKKRRINSEDNKNCPFFEKKKLIKNSNRG